MDIIAAAEYLYIFKLRKVHDRVVILSATSWERPLPRVCTLYVLHQNSYTQSRGISVHWISAPVSREQKPG